jgi:hypothetical protein
MDVILLEKHKQKEVNLKFALIFQFEILVCCFLVARRLGGQANDILEVLNEYLLREYIVKYLVKRKD